MSYVVYVDGPGTHTVDVKAENEVLYVTLMSDLISTFEDIQGDDSWDVLNSEQQAEVIRTAGQYMEGFNGGSYSWTDALNDAINDTLRGDDPSEDEYTVEASFSL